MSSQAGTSQASGTNGRLPRYLTSDLMRLAVMEIAALIALRILIINLYGIDLFNFKTPMGKVLAGIITVSTFTGLYKILTIDGKLEDIGERVLHGGGTPSLSNSY